MAATARAVSSSSSFRSELGGGSVVVDTGGASTVVLGTGGASTVATAVAIETSDMESPLSIGVFCGGVRLNPLGKFGPPCPRVPGGSPRSSEEKMF